MLTMRNMMTPMRLFAIATLAPAALIGLGTVFGGIWVALAVFYLTAFTSVLDRLVQKVSPAQEFPNGDALSVTLPSATTATIWPSAVSVS